MKKILLFATCACSLFLASSCSNDDEPTTTNVYKAPAYNHFAALDGSSYYVAEAQYNFTLRFPATTIQLASSSVPMPGGSPATFITAEIPLQVKAADVDGLRREALYFQSANPQSVGGANVRNLSGWFTEAVYHPELAVAGYPTLFPNDVFHYTVMQYDLNDKWLVRTFWSDITFCGNTSTTMPGASEPFTSSDIKYRVVMNLDNPSAYTADIIFYNAQFAPNMPKVQAIVIKNLAIKFDVTGYSISGENLVPSMLEAGMLVEAPKFMINEFNLTSGGDLTSAKIAYRVAGAFRGEFEGNWIAIP